MSKSGSRLSKQLSDFLAQAPLMREPHIPFLRDVGGTLPPGSIVIDVGSGSAPYRELFQGLEYRTYDRAESIYSPEHPTDGIGSATDLPCENGSVAGIICTQVLEHVAEPWLAFEEFFRVLEPGGFAWITTPFVWYLHEIPYDYYRYTPYALRFLAERAGFNVQEISPMSTSPQTVSQLLQDLRWTMGRLNDQVVDEQRDVIEGVLQQVAALVEDFSPLDGQRILPLGYSMKIEKPTAV